MTVVMVMLTRMAVAAATGVKSIEGPAKTVVGTKAEMLGIESGSIQIITGHTTAAEHRSAAEQHLFKHADTLPSFLQTVFYSCSKVS